MHIRSATKVGLAVLMSVATFIAIWYFLNRQKFQSNTYPLFVRFADAQNITSGTSVHMAGVEVGAVKEIGLTKENEALLELRINRQYTIPKGSKFVITAGGLIGEKYVSVRPLHGAAENLAPSEVVRGQEAVQIEDLMARASQLAGSADLIMREARLALVDTRTSIKELSAYVQDPRLKAPLLASLKNAELASQNILRATDTAQLASRDILGATGSARRTAGQLESFASQAQPSFRRTLASVERSAGNVDDLTGALNEIVAGDDVRSGLGATMNNIRLASEQLPVITKQLASITGNVEKLSGDPAYATGLRATLENLRLATENARLSSEAINESVQRLTGRFRRRPATPGTTNPNSPASTAPAVPFHATLDLVQNVDPGHFHADVNAVVPFGPEGFVKGGIWGLGEENRLNLQFGQTFTDRLSARYGLHKGWLGLGLDNNLGQDSGWSADLYNPNRPSLDVFGRKQIRENTSVIFGVEKIFQNPTPSIGVRIRR